jgi:CheY-like chemotaxis protein
VPQRILLVEDHPLNLELARDILEAHGYEVWAAGNAAECFACLQSDHPDLILMDIQLPGMDGLQITRALRADPATRGLLIVAMTAHAMAEDREHVLAAGCDGYLVKPIQTRLLAQQVAAFIDDGAAAPISAPTDQRLA